MTEAWRYLIRKFAQRHVCDVQEPADAEIIGALPRGKCGKWRIASREPEVCKCTASGAIGKMQLDGPMHSTQFAVSPSTQVNDPQHRPEVGPQLGRGARILPHRPLGPLGRLGELPLVHQQEGDRRLAAGGGRNAGSPASRGIVSSSASRSAIPRRPGGERLADLLDRAAVRDRAGEQRRRPVSRRLESPRAERGDRGNGRARRPPSRARPGRRDPTSRLGESLPLEPAVNRKTDAPRNAAIRKTAIATLIALRIRSSLQRTRGSVHPARLPRKPFAI